jgi:hypothetical protein
VLGQSESAARLQVIDGQQRLATMSLLLAGIVAAFRSKGDNERATLFDGKYLGERNARTLEREPKLLLGEADDTYFRLLIRAIAENTDLPEPAPTKPSQGRLYGAYTEVIARVIARQIDAAGRSWVEYLIQLQEYLHGEVDVLVIQVGTAYNAYQIFETLNDRGLRLTTSDLLKNYLFGQAGGRLDQVRAAWTETSAALEASGGDDVFPTFLRHYWIANTGMVREKALFRAISDEIRTPAATAELVEGLARSSEVYAALANPSHSRWTTTQVRDALAVLSLFRVITPRPLLLAAVEHLPPSEVAKIVVAVANWSIRLAVTGGLGSGRVEDNYGHAAVGVSSGQITRLSQLRTQYNDIIPSDGQFREAFQTASIRNRRQARYILARLEKQLRVDAGERELVVDLDESNVDLEHIMPQGAGPDWPGSAEEKQFYLNRIGNLTLLLASENRDMGDAPFSDRIGVYATSQIMLTQELATRTEWNFRSITDRQRVLARLAVRAWPR